MTEQTAPVTPAQHGKTGIAIAAMVVGIVAFLTGWVPFFGFLAGVAGVILGIFGLKKNDLKGMSVTGIVTGGLAVIWSLITTVVFIIALATVGLTGSAIGTAANQISSENQALVDAQKNYEKGETANFAGLEVTVNSVTRNYTPEESYLQADDGEEYVVVNLTVKNATDSSEYVSSFDFDVNENGVATGTAFLDVEPAFDGGNLSAGASTTGNLVYEVTEGATGLKLQYDKTVYTIEEGSTELVYTLAL